MAVEWQRLHNEVCGGCGQPLIEALDEASDYEAHVIVCHACLVKEQKERADAQADNVDTAGRKIAVTYAGRRPVIPELTPSGREA